MKTSRKLAAAAGVAGFLALTVIIVSVAPWRRAATRTLSAPAVPAGEIAPVPPRPVPAALASGYREIHDLLRAGQPTEAVARFPPFLSQLSREWGDGSSDLAPYHYDFALALKLAGRQRECLEVSRQARRLWPGSLQLEVVFLTTAAEAALAARACPPEVEEGLRQLLRDENVPRLRGLRVDPAGLQALRARLLESAGRNAEALAAADEGLRLDGRHALLREVRARALLGLERSREAAELLRGLVAEKATREREMFLGSALLGCGKAEEAYGIVSRLLAEPSQERAAGDGSLDRPLCLLAARALVELNRAAEARERLRQVLLEEPESIGALQLLATTLNPPARDALQRRVRELLPLSRTLVEAQKAEAAGFASSGQFHRAAAALRLERPGEAMARLAEAVRLSPRLAPLRAELSRAALLLGRADLAERALRDGLRLESSPLLGFELARILAREGRSEEARNLLGTVIGQGSGAPGGGTADSAAAAALAEAWLELADPAQARAALATAGAGVAEEKPLLLAEAALIEGKDGEARNLLAGGADPGFFGALRARALRAALDLRRSGTPGAEAGAGFDPSDLLDEPRVLRASGAGALPAALERAAVIQMTLRGKSGEETADGYRRLFFFYSELGARRKARECAWMLLLLRKDGADELRIVARALSRPEDAVARMSILSRARKVVSGDAEIEAWWREGSAFLGWDPR